MSQPSRGHYPHCNVTSAGLASGWVAILGLLPHPDPQDRVFLGPRPRGSGEGRQARASVGGSAHRMAGVNGHHAGQQRDRSAEDLLPLSGYLRSRAIWKKEAKREK